MDNLFYILIGVAWVGYSLYSARQKSIQKQQSSRMPPGGPPQSSPFPTPGNQGGGKSIFDDILRELSGETRPVPQMQQPAIPVIHSIPKTSPYIETVYEPIRVPEYESRVTADSSQSKMPLKNKPMQIKKQVIGSKNFNLRQAVIYKELLNPKYF